MLKNDSLVEVFHELKNPLSTIKINIDLLKEFNSCTSEKNILVIENEISKIENIMNKFLCFNNNNNIEKDLVFFSEIINSIIEENELSYPDVNFVINQDEDLSILAYEYHMYMMFSNIIVNSIEAINGVGHIVVNIFEKEGVCNIEIIDDGYGITNNELQMLNQGMYSSKPKGSGLGTNIVKKIVNIYNGEFILMNNEVGTKAIVKMPIE